MWVECVLFSVQTLSESLATSCFFVAAALLHRDAPRAAIIGAGFLLGLTCVLRFPYGPAIAAYALIVAGRDWQMWRGLMLGGGAALAVGGIVDLMMGLTPYQWILTNYQLNIGEQRMLRIGGHSTWTYAEDILRHWKVAFPAIILLAALGWRQHRALLAAAAINVIVHQLIGHKEYRYLWLSVQIVLLVAAFGSVELVQRLGNVRRFNAAGPVSTIVIVLLWAEMSLALALQPKFRGDWRTSGNASRYAASILSKSGTCGLAVPSGDGTRFGYALLHERKPVFLLPAVAEPGVPSLADPGNASAGFNTALTWKRLPGPKGFRKLECSDSAKACLYWRPGGCTIDASTIPHLHQQVLQRLDM